MTSVGKAKTDTSSPPHHHPTPSTSGGLGCHFLLIYYLVFSPRVYIFNNFLFKYEWTRAFVSNLSSCVWVCVCVWFYKLKFWKFINSASEVIKSGGGGGGEVINKSGRIIPIKEGKDREHTMDTKRARTGDGPHRGTCSRHVALPVSSPDRSPSPPSSPSLSPSPSPCLIQLFPFP